MLLRISMRFALVVALLGGCFGSASGLESVGADDDSPAPGQPAACSADEECVAVGATCCDCPSMATSIYDAKAQACDAVPCDSDPSSCASNVIAACDQVIHQCVLACAPLECLACPNGYITEPNGCLSCTCADPPPPDPACTVDADCSRVRADCCGCAQGGEDTAVATSDAAAFDQNLMCEASPQCPGQSNMAVSCGAELAPRCVGGGCVLLDADMPANACGRADLPACGIGETCRINVDPAAGKYGLGVCVPDGP